MYDFGYDSHLATSNSEESVIIPGKAARYMHERNSDIAKHVAC